MIISFISNTLILIQNKNYEKIYQNGDISLEGIIDDKEKEDDYYITYKLKVLNSNKSSKCKNTKVYIKIRKNKSKKENIKLEYGDKITLKGEFIKPKKQRNYGGFDYEKYLKTIGIYGTIKVENFKITSKDNGNKVIKYSKYMKSKIKENTYKILKKEQADIFIGLIIGDTKDISKELKEEFKISNLSHVLAISGTHISYLIIGISIIFQNILGKRKTYFITIIFLITYSFITGFAPSIVRAILMGITYITSKIVHRKNNTINSISLSLLIILIQNPYSILDLGLQFSYLGTISIIMFKDNISYAIGKIKLEDKNRKDKRTNKTIEQLKEKTKEIIAITISAQILILPVTIYHSNIVGIYFILSNFIISIISGPILALIFTMTILTFISVNISQILAPIISIGINLIIGVTNVNKLPFSKIYIATPNAMYIIIYFVLIVILNQIYKIYKSKKNSGTEKRVKNLIELSKYRYKERRKKVNKIVILIFIISIITIKILPRKMEINFVDVGQGDATFIITPQNQTILIDGGGNLLKENDIGKNTLLPYILDKGYTKLDYVIITHFDQDHVGGIISIAKELKIENIIIQKQGKESENYKEFLEIVRDKKIRVTIVKLGDEIKIEKDIQLKVLWPKEEQIKDNILNNNSLVIKLIYNKFSLLLTGDIEEIAEKEILKYYKEKEEILKANILKVAHHGSKTSTTEEFLNNVDPQIALIGVGENNNFGHPNENILKRLENIKCKIYRTDLNGEITIKVNKNGRIWINKILD